MQPLTDREIQTLNSVRLHEPGVVELLRHRRASIYTEMEVAADTSELHALRGKASVMTWLIGEIEKAGEAAERLAAQRR